MRVMLPLVSNGTISYASVDLEDQDAVIAGSLQQKIQSLTSNTTDQPPSVIMADVAAGLVTASGSNT